MKSKPKTRPKKDLGQNFLINQGAIAKIIKACDLSKDDVILEIGPGRGAITGLLSDEVKKVTAIEKDKELTTLLTNKFKNTNVKIISSDILEYPFSKIEEGTKMIGNLPYNIATPIIEKVIHYRDKIPTFFMMVQLEHGLRMAAIPGSKQYGAFSCFVQMYADVRKLFTIKNTSFYPKPKVQSCFLRMDFHKTSRYKTDEKLMFKIVTAGFGQRRKTILNALSKVFPKDTLYEAFEQCTISPKLRAENLSLKDYANLANELTDTTPGVGEVSTQEGCLTL